MHDDLLFFNGVNGATGDYGLRPMTGRQLTDQVAGERKATNSPELKRRFEEEDLGHFGVKAGVEVEDLAQAGWGVIFPAGGDPAVREALQPLLDHRRQQAGDLFQVYEGAKGYRQGWSKERLLRSCGGGGSGPVDPEKVPYYLLLVGDPDTIPFRIQNLLGVPHAVGRIAFDTPQDYAQYAAAVVAAEKGEAPRRREMGFFAASNTDDKATGLSTKNLVRPLMEKLSAKYPDWKTPAWIGSDATKANLLSLLGGENTPSILLSATHGMEYPSGDPKQLPFQGALLCQDWPGPRNWKKPIPQDFFVAGDDLADAGSLLGMMHFSFACYGGGTPRLDEYAKRNFEEHAATIAPQPFLADLPKRMLCHPKGGALAAVAHVDRAWTYSFMAPGLGSQTNAFESTFEKLLDGVPVGAAMEYFTNRYAEISTVLNSLLEQLDYPDIDVDPWDLAAEWTANNDARGYLIIGDPAVRLNPAGAGGESAVVDLQQEKIEISQSAETAVFAVASESEAADEQALKLGQEAVTDPRTVVVSTRRAGESEPAIRTWLSLDGETVTEVGAAEMIDEDLREIHGRALEQALRARLAALGVEVP